MHVIIQTKIIQVDHKNTTLTSYPFFYKSSLNKIIRYFFKSFYFTKVALYYPFSWNQLVMRHNYWLLHFSTNWWYLLDIFYFPTTFSFACWTQFINFYFQLVKNLEHVYNLSINWYQFSICWKCQSYLLFHYITCRFQELELN